MKSKGRIYGIDRSEAMLKEAARRCRQYVEKGIVNLSRELMPNLSFSNQTFDFIITVQAIFYFGDQEKSLMEMHRISKKYALVVVPTQTKRSITSWPNHYSVLHKHLWERLFKRSDWKILKYKKAKYLKNEYGFWDNEYRWLLEKDTA